MTLQTSIKTRSSRAPGLSGVLVLMTLVQIIGSAAVLALTALAPQVAGDLGIGAHWIGYQISLIYFVGMFLSAFAGGIVERIGAARLVAVEMALFAGGFLLLASGSLWGVALAALPVGIAYGINNPVSSELLDPVTPRARRGLVFSVKQSGVPLGAVVANLGFPALTLALGGSWQQAMLAAVLAPLATTALWWAMFGWPDRPRREGRRTPMLSGLIADQRYILGNPSQRALAFLGGVFSAMQLIVTAFAVVSLVEAGWSNLAAGGVAASLQILGATGRVVWGLVADRVGGFRVLSLIGMVIGVLTFSLLGLGTWSPTATAAIFIVLGFVATGWNGVLLAATARTAPKGRVGGNTGGVLVYTFIGVMVGPSIFAAAYTGIGDYGICFALSSLLGFSGAAVAWWGHRHESRLAAE